MDETPKKKPGSLPGGLQLKIDEDVAQGGYSNFQIVGSNETEFVMDFAYVQPQQPVGKINARVILSPKHAKGLLKLLEERVQRYEDQHGEITPPVPLLRGFNPGGNLPN